MPPKLSVNVEELSKLQSRDKIVIDKALIQPRPGTPSDFNALTRLSHVVFQWKQVEEADGYKLRLSLDQNFDTPDWEMVLPGNQNTHYPFFTGYVPTTIYGQCVSTLKDEISAPTSVQNEKSLGGTQIVSSITVINSTFDDNQTDIASVDIELISTSVLILVNALLDNTAGGVKAAQLVTFADSEQIDNWTGLDTDTARNTPLHIHSFKALTSSSIGDTVTCKFTLRNATDTASITVANVRITVINLPDQDAVLPGVITFFKGDFPIIF